MALHICAPCQCWLAPSLPPTRRHCAVGDLQRRGAGEGPPARPQVSSRGSRCAGQLAPSTSSRDVWWTRPAQLRGSWRSRLQLAQPGKALRWHGELGACACYNVPPIHPTNHCRVPEECPAEVRQIILECLEARPSLRPSALQLVERLGRAAGAPPPGLAAQPQSPPQNASAGNPGAAAIIAQAGAAGQQEGELELAAAAAGWVQGPGGAQAERQLAVGPQAVQEEQPMPAFGEQAAAPAPRAAELFAAGAELGEPPWAGRATGSSQPGTPHQSAPGAVQLGESLELAPGMPRLSAEADTAGEAVSGNEARSGEVAPAR